MTTKRPPKPKAPTPRRRDDTVRIPWDVARRVSDGHPWIFSDALKGRTLPPESRGRAVDITDPDGRFVARALVDPDNNPILRVFSARAGQPFNREFLQERVERCLAWRQIRGHGRQGGFRLINGDAEGIPAVTVDFYADYLVVCFYSPLATVHQEELFSALSTTVRPTGIYLQHRFTPSTGEPRPGARLVAGTPAPPEVELVEGRCRYVVDVSAPSNPGLFLDMRAGRVLLAELSGGCRVLNCFSYTGAFSVAAAAHGARTVVSVDSAARAHGRARRNFEVNRLDLADPRFEFITGDAFATLARLADREREFDLIILDPPTFSKGARGQTFTALKDYAELVKAAVTVLAADGVLLACCNAAKLPAQDLDRALGRGAAWAGRRLVVTRRLGLPDDFPALPAFTEGAYLKILAARRVE